MSIDEPILSGGKIAALAKRLDRPIVLVGMMGAGKSTVGRKLAQILELPFCDADEEIETAAQLSISEIFDKFGEDYFRSGERRVIARLVTERGGVIATGGGAFCQDETRELILEKAIAVWLDSDVDTLVERVGRKDTRPLLRGGDPREIVERLRAEREPHYSQAQLHITSGPGPHQQTALRILEALDQWL
jgi:shikimate kinase